MKKHKWDDITKKTVEELLQEEEKKVVEAETLSKEMDTILFGMLNPRWWSVRKKLSKVVKSFRWGHYQIR